MSKEYSPNYIPEISLRAVSEKLLALEQETQDFLLTCIECGALNPLPDFLTDDDWNEDLHFLFRYVLGKESQNQLGKFVGLNRYETVKKLRATLQMLWENLPPIVRKNYDPQEISLKKSEKERIKNIYLQIQIWKEAGLSPEQILEKLGMTNMTLSQIRTELRHTYGIEVETLYSRSKFKNSKIAAELKRATDDGTIQSLLNMINRGFYNRYAHRSEEDVIVSLRKCIPDEFHFPREEVWKFITIVVASDIPVGQITSVVKTGEQSGEQKYFFVAAQHKERVKQLLLNEPSLTRFKSNPVEQYAGPIQEKLPTTTLLEYKIGYQTLSHLYKKYKELLPDSYSYDLVKKLYGYDCPVPIFRRGNLFYYLLDHEEQLLTYLKKGLSD